MFRDVYNLQVNYNNRSHVFDLSWSSKESRLESDTNGARFKWYVVKFWSGKKTADPTHMEVVTTTLEHLTYRLQRYADVYPKYIEISANAESLNPNDGVYVEIDNNGHLVRKNCGIPMNSSVNGIAHWSSAEIFNLECKYLPESGKLEVSWISGANLSSNFGNFNVDLFVGKVYLDKYTVRDSSIKAGTPVTDVGKGKLTKFTAYFNLHELSLDEDEYKVVVTPIALNGSEMGEGASYLFTYDPENVNRSQHSTIKKAIGHNSTIEKTGHLADMNFRCTSPANGSNFLPNPSDCCRYDFAWNAYGKYTRYKLVVTGYVKNYRHSERSNGSIDIEYCGSRTNSAATGITETHINADNMSGYILIHEPGKYFVQLVAHDGPEYLLSAREITLDVSKEMLRPSAPGEVTAKWLDSKMLQVSWKEDNDKVDLYRIGLAGMPPIVCTYPDYNAKTKTYSIKYPLSNQIMSLRENVNKSIFKGYVERVRTIPVNQGSFRDMAYVNLTNGTEFEIPIRL